MIDPTVVNGGGDERNRGWKRGFGRDKDRNGLN